MKKYLNPAKVFIHNPSTGEPTITSSTENLVSPPPRLTPLGRLISRPAEAATHNLGKPILYKEAAGRHSRPRMQYLADAGALASLGGDGDGR